MRVTSLLSALCAAALASAKTTEIYIQPLDTSSSAATPNLLAEISYDQAAPSTSFIVSYDAPDIPETASLVRVGVYDPKAARWTSGTTVASVENFSKGFSPTLMLSVDAGGRIVSVACKGVQIDAGQTRDFGPQVLVLPETKGKRPQLNKPVVLTPEGKKVEAEPEKTFLQKYWWMIGIAVFVALSGGGGSEK